MKRLASLALALFVFTACDDDDDPDGPEDLALVRIVNAAPEAANASVSVFEGTTQLAGGVGFQTATTCSNVIELDPGQHTLVFRRTGQTTDLETETFDFDEGETYTIVLFNSGTNLDAVVFRDDPTAPGAGNNAVRIINATNTAGDVFVTAPAGALTPVDIGGLASGAQTTSNTFREFPTTDTQFRLFNVGATTGNRGDITITGLPTSRMTTVIFTEPQAPTGTSRTLQMNPC